MVEAPLVRGAVGSVPVLTEHPLSTNEERQGLYFVLLTRYTGDFTQTQKM